jgi:hypothetical protein
MYTTPNGAFDPVIQDPSEGYRRAERVVAAYTPFLPPPPPNFEPAVESTSMYPLTLSTQLNLVYTVPDDLPFEPAARSSPRPLYLHRHLPISPKSLIPSDPTDSVDSPLLTHPYLLALHASGHLTPLDTSRKVLQQRYRRGLEKMGFKDHWIGFLETLGRKGEGGRGWTVRFQGELGQSRLHFSLSYSFGV